MEASAVISCGCLPGHTSRETLLRFPTPRDLWTVNWTGDSIIRRFSIACALVMTGRAVGDRDGRRLGRLPVHAGPGLGVRVAVRVERLARDRPRPDVVFLHELPARL